MINFSQIFNSKNNLVIIGGDSFYQNILILQNLISIRSSFNQINFYLNDDLFPVFSLLDCNFIQQNFDLRKIDNESIIINFSKKIHQKIHQKMNSHLYMSTFGGNFEIQKSEGNLLDNLIFFLKIKKDSNEKIKINILENQSLEKFPVIVYLKKIIISPFFNKNMINIQKNIGKQVLFSVNLLLKNSSEEIHVSRKNYRDLFVAALSSDLFISDDLDFLKFLKTFGLKVQSTIKNEEFTYCNLNELAKPIL